jgi:hypothetical protein
VAQFDFKLSQCPAIGFGWAEIACRISERDQPAQKTNMI